VLLLLERHWVGCAEAAARGQAWAAVVDQVLIPAWAVVGREPHLLSLVLLLLLGRLLICVQRVPAAAVAARP
jgi:hypothetical protein